MIKQNTISTKKNGVKLLYKYIGIHIPELDKIGGKTFNNNPSQELQYEDIIKKEIKEAMQISDSPLRALIITSALTGSLQKEEVLIMTIRHFIEDTKDYHQMKIKNKKRNYLKNIILVNTLKKEKI